MATSYTVKVFLTTNHRYTRFGSSHTGNYKPSLSLPGTGSFLAEEGASSNLGIFDQQNFNTLTQAGNYSTGVSTQSENPEYCEGNNMVDFVYHSDEKVSRYVSVLVSETYKAC
jgi:hypothetical protein